MLVELDLPDLTLKAIKTGRAPRTFGVKARARG
jgi:hypothetical protein